MINPPLLPCPFCGGEAEIKNPKGDYFIVCLSCLVQTDERTSLPFAVAAWNTRALPPTEEGAMERARELLAAEYDAATFPLSSNMAAIVRDGGLKPRGIHAAALRAIARALQPAPTSEVPRDPEIAARQDAVVALANKHEGQDADMLFSIRVGDLRAAAMAICSVRLAPLSAATSGNVRLREALAKFDAAEAQCPFQKRKAPARSKPCPQCSATSSETCRAAISAAFQLIIDVRAVASTAEPVSEESDDGL